MRDDSNNSVTAGARDALALIGAQRPATHLTRRPRTESRPAPRRPRRVALARAALACVLAPAAPAFAQTTVPAGWSLTPTGLAAGDQFRAATVILGVLMLGAAVRRLRVARTWKAITCVGVIATALLMLVPATASAQQGDPVCDLPAISSFSARAVDPRHNRITWRVPASSCSFTLQLEIVDATGDSAVGIARTAEEYIHGALPSCPELDCGALGEAQAVVTYRIRTTDSENAPFPSGPWSRAVTVNRSTSTTPTAPLYLQGTNEGESGYAVLSWTKPAFPEDEAGLTYSFQASRTGTGGWRNFTAGEAVVGESKKLKVSYADLQPDTAYWFRVRATLNGRSGAWSAERAEAHVHTWHTPERVTVRMSAVKGSSPNFGVGTHGRVELSFLFGEKDSHIRSKYSGTAASCEISVGNRSSYRPPSTVTGLDCKRHNGTDARSTFNGLKLEWSQALPVNQTIWIRFALIRGTIKGPTQEIDITRNSDDELVSRNAYVPPGVEDDKPCVGTDDDPCPIDPPWEPVGEDTFGNGTFTVRWSTGGEGYKYGSGIYGDATSITRTEMKYTAKPRRWTDGGDVSLGDKADWLTADGTGRSTGTMTFRAPAGKVIDGQDVDLWRVEMRARVQNNRGTWSTDGVDSDPGDKHPPTETRSWTLRGADVVSSGGSAGGGGGGSGGGGTTTTDPKTEPEPETEPETDPDPEPDPDPDPDPEPEPEPEPDPEPEPEPEPEPVPALPLLGHLLLGLGLLGAGARVTSRRRGAG